MFSKTFVETKVHLTHVNAMQRSRNSGPHGGAVMSGKKDAKRMFENFDLSTVRMLKSTS